MQSRYFGSGHGHHHLSRFARRCDSRFSALSTAVSSSSTWAQGTEFRGGRPWLLVHRGRHVPTLPSACGSQSRDLYLGLPLGASHHWLAWPACRSPPATPLCGSVCTIHSLLMRNSHLLTVTGNTTAQASCTEQHVAEWKPKPLTKLSEARALGGSPPTSSV